MKQHSLKIFLIVLFVISSLISVAQVVINEYSASNLITYTDNYNKTEDWIELYNTASSTANIGGYHLSDKTSSPMKWEIPSGTTIPGHGYLTFWCSGRDEVVGSDYHTNFKLKQTKSTPESVVFSDMAGTIINQFELQVTQVEHSMGRESDGVSSWKIFINPTKGTSNTGTSYSAYAEAPTMSKDAGFYTGSVNVGMSTGEPSSTIYFTTNGNLPTSSTSTYTTAINVNTTKILKAITVSSNPDILPSFITFNTYFINTSHSLPILSTSGTDMQTLLNGDDSLKPHGTFEYFKDGERKDFGYGEYNKHGQDSWAWPQRSYDYIARDEMGYHSAIKKKLLTLSDRKEFQRIIIRASGDDNYPGIDSSAHMRDVFIQKFANKNHLKLDMRRGERCVSYVNGDFWGVYSIRERVTDSDYTKYYYNQDKYHIQYLMLWGGTWAEYGGNQALTDWNTLKTYILSHDMTDESEFNNVASQYDYESLIDYVIVNSFVVCTDWINWNVGWWRGTDTEGSHQKWGYILWDEDATFNHYVNYTGVPDETPNAAPCYPEGITNDPGQHIEILNKLLENETVSQYYVSRYQDLMNTIFIADDMIDLLETIETSIAPEMPDHITRWGGNLTQWHGNVQKVKDFITDRVAAIHPGLNTCYTLTGPYTVSLNVEPATAGSIKFNTITLKNDDFPWTGSYHGGMEMLMHAVEDNADYVFDHWELNNHTVTPNANTKEVTLSLTQDDVIKAVFVPSTTSNDIVINEINYKSADDFNTKDWIELYNNESTPVDISNWVFKDSDDAHGFVIPSGTVMNPGTYLVLAQELTPFQAQFPAVSPVIGDFSFGLSNGGELIRLFDDGGALVDSIAYDDEDPWPTEPDGSGQTLELINPNLDNSLAVSWKASVSAVAPHGTPGALNSSFVAAVDDLLKEQVSVVIYPNPMKSQAIISLKTKLQYKDAYLYVYDMLGKEVKKEVFVSKELSINKENLRSGIYICKIIIDNKVLSSKKLLVE
jgi:hypothetical protein